MMALTPARALCNPNEIMLVKECYTLGSLTVMERLNIIIPIISLVEAKAKPLIFNYYRCEVPNEWMRWSHRRLRFVSL